MAKAGSSREAYLDLIEGENLLFDRFSNIKRIGPNGGDGCFSLLFSAYDEQTGEKVALKFFDPEKRGDIERVKRFYREGEILKEFLDEPYVIGHVVGPQEVSINVIQEVTRVAIPLQFEFIACELADCSVEQLIYKGELNALETLLLFKEMIKAVRRIHRRRVCHRDIKPGNFLMVGSDARVSDLGAAKHMDGQKAEIRPSYPAPVGDQTYTAPEALCSVGVGDQYVYIADLYSMGAILFEMFTRTVLFHQIYDLNLFEWMTISRQIISANPKKHRIDDYRKILPRLDKSITLPDIYEYNDFVPACIKDRLNELYKSLCAIDYLKRLDNDNSIHRQLDICILILKNEAKYRKFREIKLERKLQRQAKIDYLKEKWRC